MFIDNSPSIYFVLPTTIGICTSVILLIIFLKTNKHRDVSLRGYAKSYGLCVAINLAVLVVTFLVPILYYVYYIIMFAPLMFFSFMLNKRLIQETRLPIRFISLIYKVIATFLIWFIISFPFSMLGIAEIKEMPAKHAEKQEILKFKDEVMNFETYADLTPFGLGLYKQQNKGDKYLWDVTQPSNFATVIDGFYTVYEREYNRRDDEGWDDYWDHSNKGKDVTYDVLLYEGTYIIVAPLWDNPGRWGLVYLCKDIDKDADLFDIEVKDTKTLENLKELATESFSRRELSEKLGKAY